MTDESPEQKQFRLTRRRLLQQAGIAAATVSVGGTLAACGPDETPGQVSQDTNAEQFPPVSPTQAPTNHSVTSFFTQDEAMTVDAIVARLVPGDEADPGAREAAVPVFIDTKLAQFASFATPTYFDAPFAKPVGYPTGPQENAATKGSILVQASELPRYGFQSNATPQDAYRKGLAALDKFTKKNRGDRFANLDEATQDAVLSVLEAGKAGGWPQAKGFFKMVLEDTYEGMFADPSYGGNRGYSGWNLIGYLGAQRAYTAYELQHGPQEKRVQSLAEMPAMNPGVPQGNAITPMAGMGAMPGMQPIKKG
jgi:gluconate 2-dehydrogenase gamma chain